MPANRGNWGRDVFVGLVFVGECSTHFFVRGIENNFPPTSKLLSWTREIYPLSPGGRRFREFFFHFDKRRDHAFPGGGQKQSTHVHGEEAGLGQGCRPSLSRGIWREQPCAARLERRDPPPSAGNECLDATPVTYNNMNNYADFNMPTSIFSL